MAEGINTAVVARGFREDVEDKLAEFFKTEFTLAAQKAARRTKLIRSHGKVYTYGKYQNTGQLGRNLRIISANKGKELTDGTRANYTDKSYHGMYFLHEKQGIKEVKSILRKGVKYTETLKL